MTWKSPRVSPSAGQSLRAESCHHSLLFLGVCPGWFSVTNTMAESNLPISHSVGGSSCLGFLLHIDKTNYTESLKKEP